MLDKLHVHAIYGAHILSIGLVLVGFMAGPEAYRYMFVYR